jgi:hypothetical protein
MTIFAKDPNAVLDYQFNWAGWLTGSETIASHTIVAETGITVASSSGTTTAVTVWLSGGTVKNNYNVTCRIVTSAGRTDDRTAVIIVEDK